ncbi:MAG: hypothetical protein ACRD0A_06800 [Acidimicrobiales bacterium]
MLVRVDPATVRALSRRLGEATLVARDVHDHHDGLVGLLDDAGHDGLERSARRFIDEWSFGMECFTADAGVLAQLLTQAGDVYLDVDESLVAGWGG